MANIAVLAARGFQFLWSLLILALAGNMVANAGGSDGAPNIVGYALFCAAFAMLSLFYLIPAGIKEGIAGHAAGPFTLDLLNNIFWFCGAIAFAAELTATSCTNYSFRISNYITNSADDSYKQCREGQAVTAFLWFGWAAFLVSNVFTGLALRGGSFSRPSRGPQMSKV